VLIATLVVIFDVYIIPSKSSLTQTYHIGDTINDDWKFVGFGKSLDGSLADFSNSTVTEGVMLAQAIGGGPITHPITIGGGSYYIVAYNVPAGWIQLKRA
jgi:hypothetical protein